MRLERLNASEHLGVGHFVVFQGRRNTGKSVLLRDCMHRMRESVELLVAMTPTAQQAEAFRKLTPTRLVHSQLDLKVIENLLKTQRNILAQGKRARSVLLVLDDYSFDARAFRSTVIGDLARNGRHAKITVFLTCQYACDIPPSIRSQVDVLFAMRDPSVQNRKRLWAAYFGVLDPVQKFTAVFHEATANYGALVLLNTQPSSDASDCVFWYRATLELPSFRVSNHVYWKLAKCQPPPWARKKSSEVEICGDSTVSRRA